jgi:transcriptional regulator with XRE-family HTH domain
LKKSKSVLAKNIIRLRNERGWKQSKLAEEAGLSVGFIKQIETDVTEGSTVSRRKIAQALGCTLDDLNRDHEAIAAEVAKLAPTAFAESPRSMTFAEASKLVAAFDRVPKETQEAVQLLLGIPDLLSQASEAASSPPLTESSQPDQIRREKNRQRLIGRLHKSLEALQRQIESDRERRETPEPTFRKGS